MDEAEVEIVQSHSCDWRHFRMHLVIKQLQITETDDLRPVLLLINLTFGF